MKWEGNRESDNVEDRRSGSGGGIVSGGKGIGVGGIAVALVVGWIFGINPLTVLGLLDGVTPEPQVQQQGPAHKPPSDDRMARFVSTVLADTEDVWKDVFTQSGGAYKEPKLVLFRGVTRTACGTGQSAMGPFYCPGDQKVYIDLDFYQTLKNKLGAPGEFAQAYVIAHEVGHHVQNLLGISEKMDRMRSRISETDYNALSVRLELQADCFAGVWANKSNESRKTLENGDIESAMNAAAKIGDDALQKQSQGYVVPESFTHGTSAQRVRWFNTGLQGGNIKACDTFKIRNL
ncbi:MAG: neutral zinc metallopeptidase [Betaproteobacteria bacterium]|jgi:predicted metalloprotease|nr:neutral zinc metallopeptidase [Betaproteobacteria bacterium]MBK7655018.1 neutral zinc metallopeptidase [Betaproteobacteria bacterium]MBP7780067.1 neutral zinc metallopeptidase [Burkholderiaceae bacterium]